ncbi:MAG: chemotaxis protein CheB [Alphaproteobacteria bacterium]|nr:chemotaxis protein CheB [Alphaproteobacteria bacterium]
MWTPRYKAVVMGLSAGGMDALKILVPALPAAFPLPIVIAQHIGENSDGFFAEYLNSVTPLTVKEAEDKEPICAGYIYMAPGGYHLLVESDYCFGLSMDPRVNYCCPSIDVLFESAAEAFGHTLIGVILTGANHDGSQGLKTVHAYGGLTIVQNPTQARASVMPRAALETTPVDHIVDIDGVAPLLTKLSTLQAEVAHDPVATA